MANAQIFVYHAHDRARFMGYRPPGTSRPAKQSPSLKNLVRQSLSMDNLHSMHSFIFQSLGKTHGLQETFRR
jgi:hypothetical protein